MVFVDFKDQILDVETLRELAFRFSGFMPERDDDFKTIFMQVSFGVWFYDFLVTPFVGVFKVFTFDIFKNLLSR